MVEGMFVNNAIQAEPVDIGTEKDDPQDAFFVVLSGEYK